jgi:hypothetical protein
MNCLLCNQPAQWIRHTQFAGNHPYCEAHAKQESDFLEEDSCTYWTQNENCSLQNTQPGN